MERKLKICEGKGKANGFEGCEKPSYLFGHGLCRGCYGRWYSVENSKLPKKKKRSINPVSDKELVRLAKYRKARKEYLAEHEMCEVGCGNRADQIHHCLGRIGDLLWDKEHFLAVDTFCHKEIELNPTWAKENGYSGIRTNK